LVKRNARHSSSWGKPTRKAVFHPPYFRKRLILFSEKRVLLKDKSVSRSKLEKENPVS